MAHYERCRRQDPDLVDGYGACLLPKGHEGPCMDAGDLQDGEAPSTLIGGYLTHYWGCDSAYDDWDIDVHPTLADAREYLKDRIQYVDGPREGHGDYARWECLNFTLADIGCTMDKEHAPFPKWDEEWSDV